MLIKSVSLSSPKTAHVSPGKKSLRESIRAQLPSIAPETVGASFPSLKLIRSGRFHAGWSPPPPTTSTTCCIASVRLSFRASELGTPGSPVSCLPEKPKAPEKAQCSPESGKRESWVSRFPRMQALRSVCTGCSAFWNLLFRLSRHNQNVQITKGEGAG